VNRTKRRRLLTIAAAVGLVLATLGCTIGIIPASSTPTVVITFPEPDSSHPIGREIVVQSVSAAIYDRNIARVELWVDGQLVNTQTADPPAASYTASQPWTPESVGTHILEVRAYDVDNIPGGPAQVVINVIDEAAGLTPAATGTVASTSPIASPTPGGTGADQAAGNPTVKAVTGVNVRSGPGVEYAPPIGWLAEGQTARITGRNADGTWWQIRHPPGTKQVGWVSAKPQYTEASNADGVPVRKAPPLPTPAPTDTPTTTATPAPTMTPAATPSSTPSSTRLTVFYFEADRYLINPGETVTLRWDLANAEAAYLRYDDVEEGVVAPGTKTVTPGHTTVYTLLARSAADSTTAQLTVTVSEAAGKLVMLDFVSAAPGAAWTNGSEALPWNGSDGDPRGFALWRDGVELEDGSRPSRVLETYPEWVPDGMIAGTFSLPTRIRSGDRFLARVGFLAGATGEATFVIAADGGELDGVQVVASVKDKADGALKTFEADLGQVAGAERILLGVQAGSSADQDQAVWVNPRIER
jgi:hypothetical protein